MTDHFEDVRLAVASSIHASQAFLACHCWGSDCTSRVPAMTGKNHVLACSSHLIALHLLVSSVRNLLATIFTVHLLCLSQNNAHEASIRPHL
jgi:hypothetical protein